MRPSPIVLPALLWATLLGTVLQVAMVVVGHSVASVAQLFGFLGVTLSLVAGIAYALLAGPELGAHRLRGAAVGGALAGGICALIGIAVSVALGDVPAAVLGFGTFGSAITGALGGVAGAVFARRSPVAGV